MNDSKLHQAPIQAPKKQRKSLKKNTENIKKSLSGGIVMDSTCFRFFAHVPFYINISMEGGGNAAVIRVRIAKSVN